MPFQLKESARVVATHHANPQGVQFALNRHLVDTCRHLNISRLQAGVVDTSPTLRILVGI